MHDPNLRRSAWSPLLPFLVLSLTSVAACNKDEKKAAPPPPPVVKVAEAAMRDVPIVVEAIGQTRGNEEIEISARVEGFLQTKNFQEGSFVKKGQLLYTIDSRPFQANLAQAKAHVGQAESEVARSRQDVARYEPLVAKNAVSVQDLETAKADERSREASLAAAKAAADRAQIDLGYTRVVAPDDGLIGTTEAFPGTLVGRGQNTDDVSHDKVQFEMVLADGSIHPHPGTLVFVDRNVDATTGTIRLEASFPNPGLILRPGQFAKVRAAVSVKKGAVLVQQGSLMEMQGISSVAVVKADDTVEMRVVKPADRIGSLVILESGVKPGERIIVEGMQKVRAGVKVQPQMVPFEETATATPAASSSGG
jgi:membrane fusion protein (multidrug efflux system)